MENNIKKSKDIIIGLLKLIDTWRTEVLKNVPIKWDKKHKPKAVLKAEEYLEMVEGNETKKSD